MSRLAFPSEDNSDGDDERAVDDVLEDDKVRKQAAMCFISRHHPPTMKMMVTIPKKVIVDHLLFPRLQPPLA